MKTQDFRIGNLVSYKGQYCPITQLSNWMDRVCVTQENIVIQLEDIELIKLTPEILEACGFSVDNDYSSGSEIVYSIQDDDEVCVARRAENESFCLWIITDGDTGGHTWTELQYLHQLQNLYHALTGSELTVNLPLTSNIG